MILLLILAFVLSILLFLLIHKGKLQEREDSASPFPKLYKPPPSSRSKDNSYAIPSSYKGEVQSISKSAISLEALSIVTMNIAGCIPSKEAPEHWRKNIAISTDTIRTELLKHNPDIIFLQECPGGIKWAEKVFKDCCDFNVLGATYSHSDQVILLVRKEISAKLIPFKDESKSLPGVMAELNWNDRKIFIASVHLQPFAGGVNRRRQQLENLIATANNSSSSSSSSDYPLIIGGDMNMRDREDFDEQVWDLWKLAGSDIINKYTWDTRDHRHTNEGGEGGSFNRYYGEGTKQYNQRYDRIYCTKTSVPTISVNLFRLIANQPISPSKTHFLSDHFGIHATITLCWEKKKNE